MTTSEKKKVATYPTAEEIMAGEMEGLDKYREALKNWNTCYKGNVEKRKLAIPLLARWMLVEAFGTEAACEYSISKSYMYAFNRDTKTLFIDAYNLSIISTLHEAGHAIFGSSELLACRFSTQLFRDVFPKSYAKLEWKGHMLKKKGKKTC